MENKQLQDLVISYRNGNESAFHILFENVKKPLFFNIYSFVKNKEIAEDLLQDTFIRFLNNIHKIKPNENILGFLMVISKNISLDYLKSNKKKDIQIDETIHISKSSDNIVSHVNQSDLASRIEKILNEKEFNIFILHVMEQWGFEEISKYLKIPLGSVTYIYSSSLKKIKAEIKEEELC